MTPPASTPGDPTGAVLTHLAELTPTLAFAFGALVLGLIAAALLRRGAVWAIRKSGLDATAERLGVSRALYAIGIRRGFGEVLASLLGVAAVLITLSVVAEILGLPGLAEATGALTAFLPRLLAAVVILAVGAFAADLLRNVAQRITGDREEIDSPTAVGAITYYTILGVTVAVAIEQVGLATTLINTLIAIAAAAVLACAALALALGGRDVVRDVIARHYVQGLCRPGDTLRVGEVEGPVLHFTATAVVLESSDGQHVLPCSRVLQAPFQVRRLISAPEAEA